VECDTIQNLRSCSAPFSSVGAWSTPKIRYWSQQRQSPS